MDIEKKQAIKQAEKGIKEFMQKFKRQQENDSMYSEVMKIMEAKQITVASLSELTGIEKNSLYYILRSEDNFKKTSFKNVILILDAIKIPAVFAGGKVYRLAYADIMALQVLLNRIAN